MKNLELMGVQEMDAREMKNSEGGAFEILRIVGLLDGIKGNTEVYLFGYRII